MSKKTIKCNLMTVDIQVDTDQQNLSAYEIGEIMRKTIKSVQLRSFTKGVRFKLLDPVSVSVSEAM